MKTNVSRDDFRKLARAGEKTEDLCILQPLTAKVEDDGNDRRELLFTISTDSVDRENDKISADGWELEAFRRNPVVLWAHNYRGLPVARASKVWSEKGALKAIAEFVPRAVSEFADTVYQLYKSGFLSAVSVGFLPHKWAFVEDKDRPFGIDFEKQELLEFSAVPVPANAEALMARGMTDAEPVIAWAQETLRSLGMERLKTVRDFEDFLRDAGGFSRRQATALAAGGWKAFQRDADDGLSLLAARVAALSGEIKKETVCLTLKTSGA